MYNSRVYDTWLRFTASGEDPNKKREVWIKVGSMGAFIYIDKDNTNILVDGQWISVRMSIDKLSETLHSLPGYGG